MATYPLTFPGEYDPNRPIPVDVYPQNEQEWRERYERLWLAYLLGDYSSADAKRYHLFRALDENGKEIDFVRRIFAFYKFIVDTDVRGFLGASGLTLEIEDGGAEDGASKAVLVEGEDVWRRSKMAACLPLWVRMTAALGDYWLESVRLEDGTIEIVGYDPRCVTAIYDTETGRRLLEVRVELHYLDGPLQTPGGIQEGTTAHTYTRIIDRTGIQEVHDGKEGPKRPHNLGVVPMVHLRWTPWDQPEHSLPAPHGIDQAVMRLDSFATQVGAIANRYGNPILAVIGARIGAGSDAGMFGRVFSGIPVDADVKYVEAGATAVGPILDVLKEVIAHVRETSPEFLFSESGAQESGEARSYRASAFEMKIAEARQVNLGELAEVTAMAVAMQRQEVHVPGRYPFEVEGSPILPRNLVAEIDVLERIQGWITKADRVRRLQAIGIVGVDVDPEEYALQVDDETAAKAAEFMRPLPSVK